MRRHPIHWPRLLLIAANVALPVATIAAGFPWQLLGLTLFTHLASAMALFDPYCTWLCPSASRFACAGREVWLTIDDGPDGEKSSQLAARLSDRGVRATFFVKGESLSGQPETARAILEAGHTLANHTATHPIAEFWRLSPHRLRSEIDGCNEALRRAGVSPTCWFRAPLGFKHPLLHPELHRRGMRLVGWAVRGRDGVPCPPEVVAQRIGNRVKPGAIILMHEGLPHSNETILRVVDMLLDRGYSFSIPADEALR